MKKSLMLIEIKNYKRKDGTNGSKLIFLDSLDQPFQAFTDPETALNYTELVSNDEEYNSARAREYDVIRDIYNDKMVYKVQLDR